jgi:hypothetical protein
MSSKSGEAHSDWQFLGYVRNILNLGNHLLDHNNKVPGIPLGAEHQAPDSLELPQCAPQRKLGFSSLEASDWHSNENFHPGQRCLVEGLAKAEARMRP